MALSPTFLQDNRDAHRYTHRFGHRNVVQMKWKRPVPVVGDTTSAATRRDDPTAWRFDDATRTAFYNVVMARRDVRRFRPDPIDAPVLERVLNAAHAAPSVGHSQPWRFVIVADERTRDRAAMISDRERLRQATLLDDDAARRLLDLQLEGIREAPLGIIVCCDRRTEPSGVLGRATFHDADLWSCACAIENMWLAARAEGLGMGWVTLFPPDELAGLFDLPNGVETLGWLCIGWPDERPPTPGLERAGWSKRQALNTVILRERWTGTGPAQPLSRIRAPNQVAVVRARDDADTFLTAPGSLGLLDRVLNRLGALGISEASRSCLVLAGANHPVANLGVSTYDPLVTHEILEASVANESLGTAAAKAAGIGVIVLDAGVLGDVVPGSLVCRPLEQRGDLVHEDALSQADVDRLLEFGRDIGLRTSDADLVAIGEFGIGNTTVSACLASVLLDLRPSETVGLGAGGDSETIERKLQTVYDACVRARASYGAAIREPRTALTALGGGELAVLTGVIVGVAQRGGAIVLDGFATTVCALCAVRLEPAISMHLVAGQRSRERGHHAVLEELGLEPLLDLQLRSGEGVGAVLATQLIRTGMGARTLAGRVHESLDDH